MKAANMGLVYPAGQDFEGGSAVDLRLAGERDALRGGRNKDGLAAAQGFCIVPARLVIGERSGPFHTDEGYEGVQCPEVLPCHGIGFVQRKQARGKEGAVYQRGLSVFDGFVIRFV